MPKSLEYFFFIVTFIIGVSVGTYSSERYHEKINQDSNQSNNFSITKSVQDTVLERVQSGDFWNSRQEDESIHAASNDVSSGEDGMVIEVFVGEEKISPSAKLIIKKIFARCNHSTVSIMDVPEELINLSERELAKKYSGWDIEKFSSDEVIISRAIDANCEDHYVLKVEDGVVGVYHELTEDKINFIENVDVDMDLLADEEKDRLKEGIRVYGRNELGSLLEDYVHERGSHLVSIG